MSKKLTPFHADPLTNHFGRWWLDDKRVDGNISFLAELLQSFAHNADIDHLCIEKSNATRDNISFAIEYGKLPKKRGEDLLRAIKSETVCIFGYKKSSNSSQRAVVDRLAYLNII